ncbi:MAG: PAS domain S-box protein, partial [Anaerolineae bacterium]|nr:PAS domain S-box protein [Anaerolineae bacterium]
MSDRRLENQVKTSPTNNPDDPRLSPAYRRTTEEHQVVTAKLSELEEELRQSERRYQMLHLSPAYRRITEEHQIVTAKLSQVEEELRQSERRYQMLIERASDVVYLINEQGFFIYTNPAARRLLEYETSSLVGRHFTEFLAPDWKERVAAFYRKQLQDQLPETILEFPITTRSGQTKWVEQVVAPIVHDGQVIGFQSIARDITRRKTVEETLRNTTAQLNMLVDNLQAGILMENSQRQIVFVNQAFCTMFGVPVPPAMLIGADCSAAADQSKALFVDADGFMPRIAELLAERRMVTAEELPLVDGRTLERDYIPLFVEGVYQGHLWQYRDITERKQMENAVVDSERHLRYLKKRVETILNHSSDAIVVTYGDGTIQQANPTFYSLLGYQPDEIYRDPLTTVIHADNIALLKEKMAVVLTDRIPQRIELLIQRKDGSTLPAEAGLSVIALNEDVPGVICSIRDVTGYKHLEKNLRQALEKERELGELKLRFVSMASHEFRTPLATIQTTADALRHYFHRMDEEQREKRFNKIQAQVQHMTLMLD